MRLRFRVRPPIRAGAPAPTERTILVELPDQGIVLGRRAATDVTLPFGTVSSQHARVQKVALPDSAGPGEAPWTLTDLGSANGTWVNEVRLTAHVPAPLKAKDVIRLADVELIFEGNYNIAGSADVAPSLETTGSLARRLVADMFARQMDGERALLVIESGPAVGRSFSLTLADQTYYIGRDAHCDLVLYDEDVSREHATLQRRWDGVFVNDVGSKNGVILNGEKIDGERRLRDGDVFVLGNTRLRMEDPEDRYLKKMEEEAAREVAALEAQQTLAGTGRGDARTTRPNTRSEPAESPDKPALRATRDQRRQASGAVPSRERDSVSTRRLKVDLPPRQAGNLPQAAIVVGSLVLMGVVGLAVWLFFGH